MTDSTRNKFSLKLSNFQAIVDAQLEFIQGINLICGETNSGKSAVFRAIRSAFLNPKKPSAKYLNYNADEFQVQIDYEGNNIEWDVTPKKTKYVINGEDFLKIGMTNLFKLISNHGFVLSTEGKIMNIEGEMDLPFPFGITSSELFKLFEKSIICTSDSTVILKSMKESESEINKDKNAQIFEQSRLTSKLNAVEELEKEIDLEKLNKFRADLKEQNFRLSQLKEAFDKVKQGYIAYKQLSSCHSVPEININITSEYTKLKGDLINLQYAYNVCNILKGQCDLNNIKLPDISSYNKMLQDYNIIQNNINILQKLPNKEFNIILPNLSEAVKIYDDYRKLAAIYKKCTLLKEQIAKWGELLNKSKQELDEFKVCPLCGQEIKHE